MATLDDVVTVQKNGVIGLNNLSSTIAYVSGEQTSATVTGSTLIIAGAGRLVSVSVVVAGSASGLVYNAAATGLAAASNALVATPTTLGVYQAGQHFTNGLVVAPGTGQSINVTYSLD